MTPALKGRPNPLIQAKNPAIKAYQGSSRQTMKFSNGEVGRVTPCAPSWRTQTLSLADTAQNNQQVPVGRRRRAEDCPPYLSFPLCSLRLCVFALKTRHQVHNQGKRQIGESSRWMGRTDVRMPNRVPRKNPLLGERKQVRESVPLTCLTASPCQYGPGRPDPRNQKPFPISPNQGKKPSNRA